MPGLRPTRSELVAQVDAIATAASTWRTSTELAETTGLHPRTVLRLLAGMPDGYSVHVRETPRRGRGAPVRHYRIERPTASAPSMRAVHAALLAVRAASACAGPRAAPALLRHLRRAEHELAKLMPASSPTVRAAPSGSLSVIS